MYFEKYKNINSIHSAIFCSLTHLVCFDTEFLVLSWSELLFFDLLGEVDQYYNNPFLER